MDIINPVVLEHSIPLREGNNHVWPVSYNNPLHKATPFITQQIKPIFRVYYYGLSLSIREIESLHEGGNQYKAWETACKHRGPKGQNKKYIQSTQQLPYTIKQLLDTIHKFLHTYSSFYRYTTTLKIHITAHKDIQ